METLVTKLKGTVNNPNLPVLEVMQQFTLDAITESGNGVMSDEQKWALNHFFYQIGAVDNSGIFSKLDVLYMPLICNQNVNKAFVDYKGDYTINSTNYMNAPVFSGNGVISIDGSNKIIKTQLYYTTTCQSYTAVLGTAPQNNNLVTPLQNEYPTSFLMLSATRSGSTLRILNSEVECQYSNLHPGSSVFLLTRKGTSDYSSKVIKDGTLYDEYSLVAATSPVEAPNEHRYAIVLRNLPIKVFAFGAALTDTEENTIVKAINDLQVAFPDPMI